MGRVVKPVIGSNYRPQWFEVRKSDGTYSALRYTMGSNELRLQRALLPQPPKEPMLKSGLWAATLVLVIAAVAVFA